MGSGKSTVGRILAERLGWTFVDTDAIVETRTEQNVSDVFRELGEPAFRRLEAEALESLRGRTRMVVATGGGAPVPDGNRWFFEGPSVFHLRVSLDAVHARTGGNRDRPLLALDESRLRNLYESRLPLYESLGVGVDTDEKRPREVAEEILGMLRAGGPA